MENRCEIRGMFMIVGIFILLVSWFAQDTLSAESWTGSLKATSDDPAVDPISLSFGVNPNATNGFDTGLDQPAPPMPPEPIKLDAYFPCSHQFVKRLKIDIRQSADTVSWQLKVRADSEGFTLAWDVIAIPSGLDITMTIGGSSVDMRAIGSHHFNAGTHSLTISVSSLITTGTINVLTNLPSATFTLTGPATYTGSGISWTKPDALAGQYTITYSNVPGYTTPPSEQKTLPTGGTITFTGTYVDINDPLVVSGLPDVNFLEDQSNSSIDLDDYVYDPDNTDEEIEWSYSGNVNVYVSINPSNHIVTFTALLNWNGSDMIVFKATDPGGLSDSDSLTITVIPVNDPPTVSDPMIMPLCPGVDDDLYASYTYGDVDGDPEGGSQIRWYKNDILQESYNNELVVPASATSSGEKWYFTVTPGDGTVFGSTKTSPCMIIEGVGQEELYLYPGWNLISICLDIAYTNISSVLAPIEGDYISVWTYDAALGRWKRYISGGPASLNDLNTIEPGRGYWINMIRGAILTITGTQIMDTAILLERGWNLAGYNCLRALAREEVLTSIDGMYTSIWTYDNMTKNWLRYVIDAPDFLSNLAQLEPWKGYWVHVEGDCEWVVPPYPHPWVKLKIVGYRGIITKVNPYSIEFKVILPEEGKLLIAYVDAETKITQVFLYPDREVREIIRLEDLEVGDEIVIGGMARDYGEPILDTTNIERFYFK